MQIRARLVLAKAYLKNPKWVKRAEETLLGIVHDDAQNVEAHYLLGTIYRDRGLKSRATTMFRKVLELKPDHEEALAALGPLPPRLRSPRRREAAASWASCSGRADRCWRHALLLVALAAAADDQVVLLNGDRISGRIASKGRRTLRLQTPYGVLVIGLDKIDRLQRADGTEEVLAAPPSPPRLRCRPRRRLPSELVLAISGKTFWQAWDTEAAPADPTLRLELRVDDRTMAVWSDAKVDEGEIPKAVVNSFSFTPDALRTTGVPGTKARPPELRPGRIQLALDLPIALAGPRKLRLAYQANAGTVAAPEWRDLVLLETPVSLSADAPNRFRDRAGARAHGVQQEAHEGSRDLRARAHA